MSISLCETLHGCSQFDDGSLPLQIEALAEAAMALIGLVLFLIGLGVMYFARQSDGIGGVFLFLLGLFLFGFGIYFLFFEQGEGGRRLLGLAG